MEEQQTRILLYEKEFPKRKEEESKKLTEYRAKEKELIKKTEELEKVIAIQ
jgi:hypothetical protein